MHLYVVITDLFNEKEVEGVVISAEPLTLKEAVFAVWDIRQQVAPDEWEEEWAGCGGDTDDNHYKMEHFTTDGGYRRLAVLHTITVCHSHP